MKIPDLAEALNRGAPRFQIGRLQQLRVRLRALERSAAASIFDARTIKPDYAFHVGGRTELQFNIGEEKRAGMTVIRHGVAFSLELSQTLPSIEPLLPKIARFNDYVRSWPEDFPGFRMWHSDASGGHPEYGVGPIEDALVQPGTFIMLGRWVSEPEVDIDAILADFDRLLPLYTYVESDRPLERDGSPSPFRAGCPSFTESTTASVPARTIDVALRHKMLQRLLYECLCTEAGSENVAIEHELEELGVRIDAAVRTAASLSFYELKIAPSVQACLRAGLGQLLEYAYWPSATRATELVVVGESEADDDAVGFLRLLRDRFSLPIWYRRIESTARTLGPRT